jgi:hypothetical protein
MISSEKQLKYIKAMTKKYQKESFTPENLKWIWNTNLELYEQEQEQLLKTNLEIFKDKDGSEIDWDFYCEFKNGYSLFNNIIIYWDEDYDKRILIAAKYLLNKYKNIIYALYEHKGMLFIILNKNEKYSPIDSLEVMGDYWVVDFQKLK